jgi:hypothetical protein
MNNELINLAKLLKERLQIIADHEFRDKDPNAHLELLKKVSEAIEDEHRSLKKNTRSKVEALFNQYEL